MNILLDTHLLVWTATRPERLSARARSFLEDSRNLLFFSAVSIWEIGIKRRLERLDFQLDPERLRNQLLANGYNEIDFTSLHGLAVQALPLLHRDPFDRALIAQARCEDLVLMTADRDITLYQEAILAV
ncbi:MAG: type II toxin-antitoxin system VapC family toxin [Brevundimonas sp.]|uniref:type II toxin-antitoxin system VapC family toxin n=1 Tax=Brevundimonas aurantiaca TaxID=74316 RepID=UPI001748FD6F|nr:type II toxin-antitoxin system VapC family toxin [Brevundimonas aurantiaca]MBA4786404.1 type II toxin-antitoxin system VapC family toxin [Brevundimonas sp.]